MFFCRKCISVMDLTDNLLAVDKPVEEQNILYNLHNTVTAESEKKVTPQEISSCVTCYDIMV